MELTQKLFSLAVLEMPQGKRPQLYGNKSDVSEGPRAGAGNAGRRQPQRRDACVRFPEPGGPGRRGGAGRAPYREQGGQSSRVTARVPSRRPLLEKLE